MLNIDQPWSRIERFKPLFWATLRPGFSMAPVRSSRLRAAFLLQQPQGISMAIFTLALVLRSQSTL